MNVFKNFCTFCVINALLFIGSIDGSVAEKILLQKLLTDLDPLERPVLNETDAVQVEIGLSLMRVVNVDVEKHHIELNLWVQMEWNATNLVWDPKEHGQITDVRIPVDRLWKPDIYAYNQVGENFDPYHKTLCVVKNTGTVTYVPPGTSITTCAMNMSKYPFDQIGCEIKFGSWTYDGFDLDLIMKDEDGGDISSFVRNAEWEVLGFPGKKNAIYYSCCKEPFVDVTYRLQLRRRGHHILASAKGMVFVITGLIFMSTLLVPSSAFKIIFGLFSMWLSSRSATFFNPGAGKTDAPELAIYFIQLFFVTFSVLFSNLIVYHIFYKLGSAPEWITKLLRKSPIPRPKLDAEYAVDRRDTLTLHEQNYNDLQELTARSIQLDRPGVGDWKFLSTLLDKFFFIFWIVFIFIFHLFAFPSFDY